MTVQCSSDTVQTTQVESSNHAEYEEIVIYNGTNILLIFAILNM